MKRITKIGATTLAFAVVCQCFPVGAQTMETKETTTTTSAEDATGVTKSTTTTTTTRTIAPAERQVIKTYVTKNKEKLPKSFVRTTTYDEAFPATWREKVVVGQPFEEVYYKRATPLPSEIIAEMPSRPANTSLVVLDGRVVMVEEGTRKVLDVYDLE